MCVSLGPPLLAVKFFAHSERRTEVLIIREGSIRNNTRGRPSDQIFNLHFVVGILTQLITVTYLINSMLIIKSVCWSAGIIGDWRIKKNKSRY